MAHLQIVLGHETERELLSVYSMFGDEFESEEDDDGLLEDEEGDC